MVGCDDFSGCLEKSTPQVAVLNPLSDDHQVLRQSLLPGLIRALKYNQDRGQTDVWLYELGRTYEHVSEASSKNTGVDEQFHIAGIIAGTRQLNSWQQAGASSAPSACLSIAQSSLMNTGFYMAKGIVENVLKSLP